jgi:hypothetical protein
MIVGRGDVASAILDRPDRLFFAAGVSNSAEVRESEFYRESQTLLVQPRDAHLIYFSSLSIFTGHSRYIGHKRSMEMLVRQHFGKFCIVRLGNIDWGSNPATLINHLRARHAQGLPLHIQDVYRYVVDREEFRHWLGLIPDGFSCEMNVPGRRLKVAQIVEEYVYDRASVDYPAIA